MSFPSSPTFQAPTVDQLTALFPGYRIAELIACGGMGAVYQAVQISLERTVAIKILPREFGSDASFRAGFEAEAKAMARLNHPNLIGVYDFGEVDGMLYIIMEYVPGQSLHHASYGIRVKGADAARMVAAICDGLAHAHEHGILHRDIKPANILLDTRAQPKIGDFGLARPVGSKTGADETIFGTPHYTAPEVLTRPNAVDARADIFSVGVLLHQLLTGNVPEPGQGLPSMIARCDVRFDEIIRKATHLMPEMRFTSAAAMAKELHAIAASLSRPHPAPTPSHSRAHPVPASTTTRYMPSGHGHAPVHRPAAAHSTTVVIKKSNSGAIKVLALLAVAAAAIYFLTQPGGLNFTSTTTKTAPVPVATPKAEQPFLAPTSNGASPNAVPGRSVVRQGTGPGSAFGARE